MAIPDAKHFKFGNYRWRVSEHMAHLNDTSARKRPFSGLNILSTRKPCYRKDDRAMRPIAYMGALKMFGSPCMATPTANFPDILNGFLFTPIPPQFWGCSRCQDRPCWGQPGSRGLKLFGREIILEEFQPMWSRYLNVTGRRTDKQTIYDRNTALCIKVHRAVKSNYVEKINYGGGEFEGSGSS